MSAALDFGLGGGGALIDARDAASILNTSASTALSTCNMCHIEMRSSVSVAVRTSVVLRMHAHGTMGNTTADLTWISRAHAYAHTRLNVVALKHETKCAHTKCKVKRASKASGPA